MEPEAPAAVPTDTAEGIVSRAERVVDAAKAILDGQSGPWLVDNLRTSVQTRLFGAEAELPDADEFGSLLTDSEDIRLVPSGDFAFAVLASRPEALLQGAFKVRLRPDIFGAFTTVRQKRAWYLTSTDEIVLGDPYSTPAEGALPLPKRSLNDELAVRREFLATLPTGDGRSLLEEALEDDRPFAAFSKTLHRTTFVRRWQLFRFHRLFKTMWEWLDKHELDWPSGWLLATMPKRRTSAGPVKLPKPAQPPSGAGPQAEGSRKGPDGARKEPARTEPGSGGAQASPTETDARRHLASALSELGPEELARISIPADLVLKILASVR